jgi:hypothetical protein
LRHFTKAAIDGLAKLTASNLDRRDRKTSWEMTQGIRLLNQQSAIANPQFGTSLCNNRILQIDIPNWRLAMADC